MNILLRWRSKEKTSLPLNLLLFKIELCKSKSYYNTVSVPVSFISLYILS